MSNMFYAASIYSLHGLVLRSIEEDFAGVYAMQDITGTNFVPPNANKVDLLDELVDFINTNPLQLNDIELATVFITN
jgi:hypothetical protein